MEQLGFYLLVVAVLVVPAVALYLARKQRNRRPRKPEGPAHRPHGHHRPGH